MDYKATVKINDNISLPYVWYQSMLMMGTIIGPGTIFLMLVGAFVAAFKIGNWTSFQYNLIPIITYIGVCLLCKPKWQILLSQLLSTVYALIMMAVIVGTALQLGEDGLGSPSAIFLMAMTGSFFIAACLHPQEFWCVVPGLIYLLCIPSMYLLLIIYSITNLNDVSWGTRDVASKKTKKELEEEKKAALRQVKKKKAEGIWGLIRGTDDGDDEEGGIDITIGNVLRLMAFTHKKESQDKEQLIRIADSLDTLTRRLDHIENVIDPHNPGPKQRRKSSRLSVRGDAMTAVSEGGESLDMDTEEDASHTSDHRIERDEDINPFWIEDKDIGRGEVDYLSGAEIQFWKDLIVKYLLPIDADKANQAKVAQGLKELRDKAVFFFAMFNALFVLIVFMLTLNKDILHIDWPFGVKTNITITDDNQVLVTKEYLHLEPIGIVLVFFFFAIVVIQFVAMLFHRFGTISHILASTELNCCSKKDDVLSDQDIIEKNAVEIVKQMQRLRGLDGDYDSDSAASNRLAHRKTIQNLERTRNNKKRAIGTLDVAFKKRFFALSGEDEAPLMDGQKQSSQTPIFGAKLPMRRETLKAIEVARDNLISNLQNERKGGSKMQTLGASNPHNNNKEKHRTNTRITGDTVDRVFQPNGGVENPAFDAPSSNTDDDNSSTARNSSNRLHHIPWKERNASSSDQGNTSSTTSKM